MTSYLDGRVKITLTSKWIGLVKTSLIHCHQLNFSSGQMLLRNEGKYEKPVCVSCNMQRNRDVPRGSTFGFYLFFVHL